MGRKVAKIVAGFLALVLTLAGMSLLTGPFLIPVGMLYPIYFLGGVVSLAAAVCLWIWANHPHGEG